MLARQMVEDLRWEHDGKQPFEIDALHVLVAQNEGCLDWRGSGWMFRVGGPIDDGPEDCRFSDEDVDWYPIKLVTDLGEWR